eukprot:SAG11_NODE_1133_length_5735_cov_8.895671_3_plen_407_part_00
MSPLLSAALPLAETYVACHRRRNHQFHTPEPFAVPVVDVVDAIGLYRTDKWLNQTGEYTVTVWHTDLDQSPQLIGPDGSNPFLVIVDPSFLSPQHSVIYGRGAQLTEAGVEATFRVEIRDQFENLITDAIQESSGVTGEDFSVRSNLPQCREFSGDLWAFMEALGVVMCPRSRMTFTAVSTGIFAATYLETTAGEYYVDVFVRDDSRQFGFNAANQIMSRMWIQITPAVSSHVCSDLMVDMDPVQAEMKVSFNVQVYDRFCNPTPLYPNSLSAKIIHDISSDQVLYPWLLTPSRYSGYSVAANNTKSLELWEEHQHPDGDMMAFYHYYSYFQAFAKPAGNYSVEVFFHDSAASNQILGQRPGRVFNQGSPAAGPIVTTLPAPVLVSARFSVNGACALPLFFCRCTL